MSEVSVSFDAPPTLGRFLGSDAFIRVAMGPVGSGKSSACCVELMRRAIETPAGTDGVRRSRFCVVRNTYRELADTTIKTFEEWIPAPIRHRSAQENSYTLRFDDIEALVMFRALDRPDDVGKLLSLELTGCYFNELKEIPKAVWDLMQTRVGRYPAPRSLPPGTRYWFGIWADTNPPDNDHWVYKLFEETRPEGHELFKQPGGLEPDAENLENLQPGYYERLGLGKDPEWIKVYRDGQYGFPRDGKPIYPEWQDRIHCVECLPDPRAEIILGMDFGLTPAAVLLQRDPRDGQLQAFDELVSTDMGAVTFAGELARLIKGTYPGRRIIGSGDPAGEQRAQTDERTPFDVVNAAGIPISPAPTNDWILRREAVATNLTRLTMLGRPALVIDPRCKVLRKAHQGGYCYRRLQVSGRETFADKPDKTEYSHVAEALQYALVGIGEDRRAVDAGESRTVELRFRVKPTLARNRRR